MVKDAVESAFGSAGQRCSALRVLCVQDDIAERRAIRTGAVSIDRVEILDGVAAGERIVIAGTDSFDDAERVVISR